MLFPTKIQTASLAGTKLSLQFLLSEIISRIKQKKYARLAATTLLMRSANGFGDTPLQRTNQLVAAINTDVINAFSGAVGVNKNAKTKGPNSKSVKMANIAQLLHDGGTIKVTQKMRQAFLIALQKKMGPRFIKGKGSGRGTIRIPARRFIGDVFEYILVGNI